MNEAQMRAWRALDIGPAWRSREFDSAGGPAISSTAGSAIGPTVGAATGPVIDPAIDPADRWVRPAEQGSDAHRDTIATPDRHESILGLEERRREVAAYAWPALERAVASCRACRLCESRSNTVFGVGDPHADWFVVGEAPGAEEDRRGEPFVGRAGQLLDAMLAAVSRSRAKGVFIANVLKCRPPENRNPAPEEAARCEPFLQRQLELVSPKLILVVGKVAAQSLLGTEAPIASLRGRVHRYKVGEREIPLIVTYHPAYLLRTPLDKAKAWADLQLAIRTARGA